jgi:hypothetical protein
MFATKKLFLFVTFLLVLLFGVFGLIPQTTNTAEAQCFICTPVDAGAGCPAGGNICNPADTGDPGKTGCTTFVSPLTGVCRCVTNQQNCVGI